MKNHVCIGLLLVGVVCYSNAINLQNEFNYNSPQLDGLPNFSVDVSGNAGNQDTFKNALKQSLQNIRNSVNQAAGDALLQSTSRLRQVLNISDDAFKGYISSIPGLSILYNLPGIQIPSNLSDLFNPKLPGIPQVSGSGLFSGSSQQNGGSGSLFGSLPGLPQLPGLPSSKSSSPFALPSLPGLPQLPNLPGIPLQGSSFGNLPNIPGLPSPSIPQLPKISLPTLPGLPDMNSIASGLGIPDVSTLNSPLTNGSVDAALKNLQSISDNAAKEAKKNIDNVVSSVQPQLNRLSQEVDNLSSQAQAEVNRTMQGLNSDIRDCVNKNGNPGSDGVEAARKSGQQCIQNKINEAKSIADGAKHDIDLAQLGVDYLRGNLSNCQLNVSMSLTSWPTVNASKPACIASALLSVQSETLLIPINMATRATQAVALVQGLQAYALQCVGTLMGDVAKASLSTTLAVGKCYADKQNQSSS